ncbi:ROK family protein [Microbacterium gorillae]|uniref:ROK family protein n=1 Tax=Microbacterium gorillae TaxID=1231063 RepID=UPI0006932543|nr:ROK family protein [Microbacterium gorillae]
MMTPELSPLAQCLIALREVEHATISDLASSSGLSRPTVTAALDELESLGLASRDAARVATGRPARTYTFVKGRRVVVGIDLSVDPVQLVVADRRGRVRANAAYDVRPPTTANPDLEPVRALLVATLESLTLTLQDVAGIGFAVAGLIDERGLMTSAPQVTTWRGLHVADHLSAAMGVPVTVDNDLTLCADAESRFGALAGVDTGVYALTWHHVSARLTNHGSVIRGRRGRAGEVGMLRALGPSGGPQGELLNTVPEVAAALRRLRDDPADAASLKVRDELVAGMVPALAALTLTLDPDVIVLGGALAAESAALAPAISAQLRDYVAGLEGGTGLVRAGDLGGRAGVIGALCLAFEGFASSLYGVDDIPSPTIADSEEESHMQDSDQTNTPVRVAVIGVGARSGLALNVEAVNGRVVAAVDPAEQTHERAHRLFGDVPVFASVRDLVDSGEEIDAAFVTSPDFTHAEITIELLEAGIPAYVEKPLAITIEDADRILVTAHRTGTKLYVGHNMRHMRVVTMMKEIIDRGDIGEVKAIWTRHFVGHGGDYYFKDWHAERSKGTSLLLQKGAHDIDVMHWLAGTSSRTVVGIGDLAVYGQVQSRRDNSDRRMGDWFSMDNWPPLAQTDLNPVIDVEDISMIMMRTDSGVLMSYQQCHFTPDYWRNYTVIGTEGRIENFDDGAGGEIRLWNRRSDYLERGHERFPIEDSGEGGHDGADPRTVAEFIGLVREGAPTATNPLDARDAVAAGVAGAASIRGGSEPQTIPPLPAEVVDYFRAGQPARTAD